MADTHRSIPVPETYKGKLMLNAKDIQNILGVSSFKAYTLCDGKNYPVIRMGQTVRVSTSVFFDWLNGSTYVQENRRCVL